MVAVIPPGLRDAARNSRAKKIPIFNNPNTTLRHHQTPLTPRATLLAALRQKKTPGG
jgi:hypothetical protein